jgi:RimJ/RimL family protein N-acetyltransferase
MRHDIRLEGEAFALRPVDLPDAAFIAEVRSDQERVRYLHPTPPGVAVQEDYLKKYFDRPGDYYFVIEQIEGRLPEGLVAVYDIDSAERCGEWGRWVLRRGSLAAVESALLVYRVAFDVLGLDAVFCRTVALNRSVVSFHESCGLTVHAVLPAHFRLGDHTFDAIEHRLTRSAWLQIEPRLAATAERLARKLQGGQRIAM